MNEESFDSLPQLSNFSSLRGSSSNSQRIVVPASYFKSHASKSAPSNSSNFRQLQESSLDTYPEESSELSVDNIRNISVLAKIRGRNNKIVSGSQYRHLSRDAQLKCEQCDQFDKTVKKQRETIRSLRFKLDRFEEKYNDLKLMKSNNANAAESNNGNSSVKQLSFESDLFGSNDGAKNCESCERLMDEITKMKRLLSYERTASEGLRKAYFELKQHADDDLNAEKEACQKLREEVFQLNAISNEQKITIEQLKTAQANYRDQLEKTESKLSDCMIRLNLQAANAASDIENLREINRLKNELAASEANGKTLSAKVKDLTALNATFEESLSKEQANNAELVETVAELKLALSKVQHEKDHSTELYLTEKKRVDVLEESLKTTVIERDRNGTALKKAENDLTQSRSKVASLESECKSLNIRIEEITRKMLVESENSKKAIEKAISGSVRLCVVAPTVNVHVADKKLKFKSGLSESALKDFLTSEVLDKYSFLYKQKSENSAPNGSNLESWLQKMLAQMQTSIQNHVNSAMDGAEI